MNGARKLVAHVFEGRPIQDEPRSAPLLDSGAPSSVSVGLPPLQDNPKRKVSLLYYCLLHVYIIIIWPLNCCFFVVCFCQTLRLSKRLQQAVPHFQQLLYNHKLVG